MAGRYRLDFDTAAYFAGLNIETFFPSVQVWRKKEERKRGGKREKKKR